MLEVPENQTLENRKKVKDSQTPDSRYKTLFEQVNAAAFLTKLDGSILDANHKSYELYGYPWGEFTKTTIDKIFTSSNDWEQLIEEISSKGGLNFESVNVKKDGTQFPVDISTSLFTMEGKPVMLAIIWDITERKKAEEELKASQEKYSGLFESTTDGMLVLDARGEILDVNNRALNFFNLNEEEMIGKNFLAMDLLTPKALSIVVSQFQELLSSKKATTHETDMRDKEGNLINIELSAFFLIKKTNEIENFVLVIRDISDRKQTEIKLAKEHEFLQSLMNGIPDSIYFKDIENRFIMVNKAKAANSKVKPEDMVGKTDFDFLSPEQARKAFEDDEEILKTGKFILNKIEKITHVDGSERWVSVSKIPRFDAEGNIIGTIGISRDITKWKKIEEEFENLQK